MEEINYESVWDKLEDSSQIEFLLFINKLLNSEGGYEKLTEFSEEYEEILFEIYIKSVKEKKDMIMNLGFRQFIMACYVSFILKPAMEKQEQTELEEEGRKSIEPKPQSTALQKELDELYTKSNLDDALNELGVFTKDDLDSKKGD